MKNTKPKPIYKLRKGYREIVIAGKRWQWKCGDQRVIAYSEETGERRDAYFADVGGYSYWEVQRDDRKPITPGMVARWLKKPSGIFGDRRLTN